MYKVLKKPIGIPPNRGNLSFAKAMELDRRKTAAAGMDDFISKPVDLHFLKSKIVKWITAYI